MENRKKNIKFGTICAREISRDNNVNSHILPIYATSSFEFDNIQQGIDIFAGKNEGLTYSRYGNPTMDIVAEKIAQLECFGLEMEAKGILLSSGMSAISTLFAALLTSGDTILTQGNLYGGTTELLLGVVQRLGINTILTDLDDLDNVEKLLSENKEIKAIYFETPANPTLACVDIENIAKLAKKYNKISIIDNTFATPYLQRPFAYGVDYIIHSATKFLNGHGNMILGAIIGTDIEVMKNKVWRTMKLMGTNANAFDAWLLNNGLKTLELRMDKHCDNAMQVAKYLEQHPKILKVNYPGLPSHKDFDVASKQMSQYGAMLSFEIKGGLDAGLKFMNSLENFALAPTLGDVDTLILHSAGMSHINVDKKVREANGITDGLIRISVGIEAADDIIQEIEQALSVL
ncbi:MAG: aminotransferase class I/II-fold pyridoxal phosphate-dependent enzyme [Saprospiraceae bacterium]|nr:aminotransferase class I/II-fold pyridoxal phosphate-dependent enzyme [Saprospiraceae bacterium]